MRAEVSPQHITARPGQPAVVTISITNTGTLISGQQIRVYGIDRQWATLDKESLSLFPDDRGVATLTITLPKGIPAGGRTVTVEISELTPPQEVRRFEVELTVPENPAVGLAVDPPSVSGGRKARVGLILENTGNSLLEPDDLGLFGTDEEGAIDFRFVPPVPMLGPGERFIGAAEMRAKRPWFGSPKVRPFTIKAGSPVAPVLAMGAWQQKPRLTRGALALGGLLAAATVFAVVIAASLSQVVTKSTSDRNLALQVAQAGQSASANSGKGSINGLVSLLTTGKPEPGVTVNLYQAANTADPILSIATDNSGTYTFSGLAAGEYKLLFSGAGFTQLWFPQSLTPDNATAVSVNTSPVSGINMSLGGQPVTVSGQVMGSDLAGAVLTLEIPAGAGGTSAAPASGASQSAVSGPIIVSTQTLDSSGQFSLANVPSPALYQLVVTEPGYAPSVQNISLDGGVPRTGITITLSKGGGSVSGTVSSTSGPLGEATVSASDGTTTVSTVTETTPGAVGNFTLSNLPTPDNLTLVISDAGYATQTLSLSIGADQQLKGENVTLTSGVGSVSGTATTINGAPAGGVTVTASNGQITRTTVTLSQGAIGTYSFTGLTVPSTYTVTFSRSDLSSQTQAANLTATNPNDPNVNADMVSDTASIFGTVTQSGGSPVSEVSIQLVSGSTKYQVTSASVPKPGAYAIQGIVPGTYTISATRPGGLPTSRIVTLAAGQNLQYNPLLAAAASIFGHVTLVGTNGVTPVPGTEVKLYLTSQYPTLVAATVTTDANGDFTFANVDAPQSYVVSFDYPAGSAPQETEVVTTALGQASPVCGSDTTGSGSTTGPPSSPGSCVPQQDPVQVAIS